MLLARCSSLVSALRVRLSRSRFARDVLTLVTGTVIAQAIPIVVTPILARLYTPADYGILALYTSISSIIAVLSTGRYDVAVMLPSDDKDALNTAALALCITVAVSSVVFMAVLLFSVPLAGLLGNPEIARYLYLLPLTTLLAGAYQTISCWANRKRQYKSLSANKVFVTGSTAFVNLSMGLFRSGPIGLIMGTLTGQGLGTVLLGWRVWKEDKARFTVVNHSELARQAKRYLRFPAFSLPSEFINAVAHQVPSLMLSYFWGATVLGSFSMAQRVIGLPITLIASSITGVFRERASSDYAKYGNCRDVYIRTFKSLFLLSIGPFVLLFVLAPFLFPLIFGQEWGVAGEYARALCIMYLFRFVCSPLSYMYYVAEKQKESMFISAYSAISAVVIFVITSRLSAGARTALILYSLNVAFAYAIVLFRTSAFAKGKPLPVNGERE